LPSSRSEENEQELLLSLSMTLDTPRNRRLFFLVLNFPFTLILFAVFNSLANLALPQEPSLQVLIGVYIALTAAIEIFLLRVFKIRTLAMVLTIIMEIILIYSLFMFLFLKSR
jgi:hypothetical protein